MPELYSARMPAQRRWRESPSSSSSNHGRCATPNDGRKNNRKRRLRVRRSIQILRPLPTSFAFCSAQRWKSLPVAAATAPAGFIYISTAVKTSIEFTVFSQVNTPRDGGNTMKFTKDNQDDILSNLGEGVELV